ncbi:hypothetical protein [Methylococcus geothermalis]|uniref:Uncharacterized protein n=1 Tax=Methylococcus geothermalis TaxID=2681310 RepID=A0A858Q3X1_9GAMM|nr:hypothetical protein [Methylococcus geothermalis]QJD28529.1 hypothetical protein GNH96_00120 [Methylococcus geothermalis]
MLAAPIQMQETFYRSRELKREARMLGGATYNLSRILLGRRRPDPLFVPIRSMQYLAVADDVEIVFVDGAGPRHIQMAWQAFRPGERSSLEMPVPFEVVYYTAESLPILPRLHSEFQRALVHLKHRDDRGLPGAVVVSLAATR